MFADRSGSNYHRLPLVAKKDPKKETVKKIREDDIIRPRNGPDPSGLMVVTKKVPKSGFSASECQIKVNGNPVKIEVKSYFFAPRIIFLVLSCLVSFRC